MIVLPNYVQATSDDLLSKYSLGEQGSQLVGICCFLANKYHGYLYDVHKKTKLISSFSFMTKSQAAMFDVSFMHALSENSVESYTSRVFQASMACMPSVGSHIPEKVGEEGDGGESDGGTVGEEGDGEEGEESEGGTVGEEGDGGEGEESEGGTVGEAGDRGEGEESEGGTVGEEGDGGEGEESEGGTVGEEGDGGEGEESEGGTEGGAAVKVEEWLKQVGVMPINLQLYLHIHTHTHHTPTHARIHTHTQPCPPPSMDLTLVSSNKFISSCALANSESYMIVLTKGEDLSQNTTTTTTTTTTTA